MSFDALMVDWFFKEKIMNEACQWIDGLSTPTFILYLGVVFFSTILLCIVVDKVILRKYSKTKIFSFLYNKNKLSRNSI